MRHVARFWLSKKREGLVLGLEDENKRKQELGRRRRDPGSGRREKFNPECEWNRTREVESGTERGKQ